MKAPLTAPAPLEVSKSNARRQSTSAGDETGERQRKVWDEVAKTQTKLSGGVKEKVNSAVSDSSLQLALENEKLKASRGDYIKALESQGTAGDDIIGYVFAVNGRINSADLYPSNALFRKMWSKLLAASVTEAIGETTAASPAAAAPPEAAAVTEFLASAETGKQSSQEIAGLAQQEVRDADKSLFVGVRSKKGEWVHRNYLVK